ncbi:MAG: MBOAT family protein [Spirochaetia bacterium]|nr:MBOAT family protein [Spirochaetia bacterium]
MIFNSLAFLAFFLILHFLYWTVRDRYRLDLILAASVIFYGYWNVFFLFHFLLVILINYLFYRYHNYRYSKNQIIFIVVLNLLNLGFFKYYYFFIKIIEDAFLINLETHLSMPKIILPLAISFYTFQIIALQVDVYRGVVKNTIPLKKFFLFIMFFPQLIAGPIMRYDQFFPQLEKKKRYSDLAFNAGMILIIMGILKKVVIADSISPIIDPFFNDPAGHNWQSNLLALYAFAIQIYSDFAGYTDMACGMALLLGFDIPVNFRAPYFSSSFRELWQRWHITLSTWLRDYLYISLGGSKGSVFRTQLNMFLTMLLGGLWHGANYTFVIWGALHGLYLYLERFLGLYPGKNESIFIRILRIFIIFHLSVFSLVFFRPDSIEKSFQIIQGLFSADGKLFYGANQLAVFFLLAIILHVYEYNKKKIHLKFKLRKILVPIAGFFTAIMVATLTSNAAPFIYFQF